MGKKRFFNFKNLFFVSFLAVAGIFSATAIIKDKQVEETPVVEKAEAATPAYLYFDYNNIWSEWGCARNNIRATFFKNDGTTTVGTPFPGTVLTEKTVGDSVTCGRIAVPSGAEKVEFNGWSGGSEQNKTIQYEFSTDDNCYCFFKITSRNGGARQTGTWHCFNPDGQYVYFTPSSDWAASSATFKINWFFNSSYGDKITDAYMTSLNMAGITGKLSSQTTYYASLRKPFRSIQILRMNSGKSSQLNYSGCIEFSGSFKWIEMNPTKSGDNWTVSTDQSDSSAHWGNLDLKVLPGDLSASTSTARLFCYTTGTSWGGTGNGVIAVRAWGGSASPAITGGGIQASIYPFVSAHWIVDEVSGGNTNSYGYVDIPQNVTYFQFVLMDDANGQGYNGIIWNYQTGANFTFDGTAAPAVYYCVGNSGKDKVSISMGGARDGEAGPQLMTAVLEAINTCSNNAYAGYNAQPNIDNRFGSHMTDAAKTTLIKTLGEPTSNKYSAETICLALASRYAHQSSAYNSILSFSPFGLMGEDGQNATTIIIIIASSVALLSITTLSVLMVRKRKRKEE